MTTNKQPTGWLYQVAWNHPYSSPPDGRRVLAEMYILSDGHGAPRAPAELIAYCTPGYSVHITAVKPLIQEQPAIVRAAIRRKRLERRNTQKAPLFAEQFTAEDIARKPDYYLDGQSKYDAARHEIECLYRAHYERMLADHGRLLLPDATSPEVAP